MSSRKGETMRKFEDVDIIKALQKIMSNNTLYYQSDFEYDAETLKNAKENQHFLWMSRSGGTWLINERNAHIRNTYDYNTWQYYTDTKYYGVKAFAVEVLENVDGRPFGNIYELHYRKHVEEIRQSSFNATAVDVTFKATHWDSETTRTFDVAEYNDNWRAICDRYGEPKSVSHIISSEDENNLKKILAEIRARREEEATPGIFGEYIQEMVRERFREYGYKQDNMTFTTSEDARAALKHLIPVYVLHPDNTAVRANNTADVDKAVYNGHLLGMSNRDKRLLNFLKAGNTLADLPFSHNELQTIFYMALDKGKENIEDEQQRKAVDSVIKILDTILFSNDGRDLAELELDNELEEGIAQ